MISHQQLLEILTTKQPFALLEDLQSLGPQAMNRLFTEPCHEIKVDDLAQLDAAFAAIDAYQQQGLYCCGYMAYEAGSAFFPGKLVASHRLSGQPYLHFMAFKRLIHLEAEVLQHAFSVLAADWKADHAVYALSLSQTKDDYLQALKRIKHYIEYGDTYQVNYTLRYRFNLHGAVNAFYAALREQQPVAYAALLHFANYDILSLSPELFIKKQAATLIAKPMKGTTKRGRNPLEDAQNARELQQDVKNRAENIMVVDMVRNDLAKISQIGSVKATDLFTVQTFRTVQQMISTVTSQCAETISFKTVMQNIFPCASITGAPKLRTMQIINELEAQPRGVYTGAIGYLLPNNDFCFNVPIRTIHVAANKQCELGIGSGVVADSSPTKEFAECLLKANFLKQVNAHFHLIECFRYVGKTEQFERLSEHMQRLKQSAEYFGFHWHEKKLLAALAALQKTLTAANYKIKIKLWQNGEFVIEHMPINVVAEAGTDTLLKTVMLSDVRVDSQNIFYHHKTSRRGLYQAEYNKARELGFDEVIFQNERGEITEASYHNIFIQQGHKLLTPSLDCGLLAGVYRQLYSRQFKARETIVYADDLANADRIILTNSVRGAVEVRYSSESKISKIF